MQVERHKLANGLDIVLHHDDRLPLIAINIWYHVGSKNERRGRTGFAHLFEHMLFQGSQNVDDTDHFKYVQQVGGVANGSTWYDRTNYYETLPAHNLELGLWLESDRMGFLLPAMTQDKLENQRSVVMNERRQRVDNQPYGRATEHVHEMLYPENHPYHWPVIGYMEDIAAATLDDVSDFFSTYYTPNNAVLTLAGDFEKGDALGLIERYFGDIPRGPEPQRPDAAMPRAQRRVEHMTDKVSLPRVYWAFPMPGFGTREWYAASLFATVATGGKSAPLYKDLVRDRQIAQSVFCYVGPMESCSTFGIVATGKPDVSADELAEAVEARWRQFLSDGVDAAERERALRGLLFNHYNEMQSLDNRADALSMATVFLDDPQAVFSEPERYQAIDEAMLIENAREYLDLERSIRLSVSPDPNQAEAA